MPNHISLTAPERADPTCVRPLRRPLPPLPPAAKSQSESFCRSMPSTRPARWAPPAGLRRRVQTAPPPANLVSFHEPHPGDTLHKATLHDSLRKLQLSPDEFVQLLGRR